MKPRGPLQIDSCRAVGLLGVSCSSLLEPPCLGFFLHLLLIVSGDERQEGKRRRYVE